MQDYEFSQVNQIQREIDASQLPKHDLGDWSARVYGQQPFAGAGKTNTGFLVPLERKLAKFVLPRVLCSILIGYSFLIPQKSIFSMMLMLCVLSAFMFHTFLMLAATDEFKVSFSRFGPTELRIALLVINALLVKFGARGLNGALPWVAFGGVIALSILAYIAQRRLWQIDMQAKAEAEDLGRD